MSDPLDILEQRLVLEREAHIEQERGLSRLLADAEATLREIADSQAAYPDNPRAIARACLRRLEREG